MRGRQLAGARGGDGQNQILGRRHFGIAVGGKLACFHGGLILIRLGFFDNASHQAALFQIGFTLGGVGLKMADDGHGDDLVALRQPDTAHAGRAARFEDADIGGGKADGAAKGGDQHDIIGIGADGGVDQGDAFGQVHRDLAVAFDIGEIRQIVLAHVAVRGGKDDLQVVPMLFRGIDRHQGGDRNAGHDRQDIDHGLALGGAPGQRQAPGFQFVDHAVGGEKQQRRMGVGDEQSGNHVIGFGRHRGQTLAAAVLLTKLAQGRALDVTARGDGDDHILTLDQVFVFHVARPVDNLGAAGDGEGGFDLTQFVADDCHDAVAAAEDFKVVLDLAGQFFQLVSDLFDAKRGQALQAQFQNGAGLHFGQVIGAVIVDRMAGVVDQADIGRDVLGGPAPGHQFFARLRRVGAGADGADNLIDVGDGDGQTAQDMAAFAGAAQFIGGAAGDDLFAEGDEVDKEIA